MNDKVKTSICAECSLLSDILVSKNSNYGNSVYQDQLFSQVSQEEALWIRLGDKIRRLIALRNGEKDRVGESINDTLADVAGYAILLRILPFVMEDGDDEQNGINKE